MLETFINRQINGYTLLEVIGRGAHGAVFRAQHDESGRIVAIKVITASQAADPDLQRRFRGEADIIARLQHPHIMPLYDYWHDESGAWMVTHYCAGGSLRASVEQGPWPPEQVLLLLDQLAGALMAAHRAQVVHRDIKPDNILFDEDGRAYLSDFGVARQLNANSLTGKSVIVGTPAYYAPEQVLTGLVTPQTDIYALGLTLYETLCGHNPIISIRGQLRQMVAITQLPLPPLHEQMPGIPLSLSIVIQRATAKQPEARYADALLFAEAFREALGL